MLVMAIALGVLAVGLIGGWMINYLADMLPPPAKIGRPVCRNCGAVTPWADYLLLRSCRVCGRAAPFRNYSLLVVVPLAALYLWLVPPHKLEVPIALGLLVFLILIAVIDLEHRLVLHATSLVGSSLGLAIGIHLHGIVSTLIGGLAGYGIMLLFYLLGVAFVRYVSRRRGEVLDEPALGYGDVNLAGIAGLLLGWPGIVFGLLITILAGGVGSLIVVGAMLVRHRYRAFAAIPYGPFLVLSIVLLLLRP
jgi:prepilin signal peptidase PulO-like enzyme (type II secretory pathway)